MRARFTVTKSIGTTTILIACPSRETEIHTSVPFVDEEDWSAADAFDDFLSEHVERHVAVAGCDCAEHLEQAVAAFVEAG